MTKQHKPLPVILDRLQHVLEANGLRTTRSQALAIAAAAFGHRNANQLAAAAKAGVFDLPQATWHPMGSVDLKDGQRLIIAIDPLAGAPFGIDMAFLEQACVGDRASSAVPTPYGHLVDLSVILDAPIIATGDGETMMTPMGNMATFGVVRTLAGAGTSGHGTQGAAALLEAVGVGGGDLATIRAALSVYLGRGYGEPSARPDDVHELATDEDREISLDGDGIRALDARLSALQRRRDTELGDVPIGVEAEGVQSLPPTIDVEGMTSGTVIAELSLADWQDDDEPRGTMRLVRDSYGFTVQSTIPGSEDEYRFHVEFNKGSVMLAFDGGPTSDDCVATVRMDHRGILVEDANGTRTIAQTRNGPRPDCASARTRDTAADVVGEPARRTASAPTDQARDGRSPSAGLVRVARRLAEGASGNGSRLTVSKADHDALVDALAEQDKLEAEGPRPDPATFVCPAEAHTDDRVVMARFDAAWWLTQASPKAIADLKDCGWGGDYPADHVAQEEEEERPGGALTEVFAHSVRMTDAGHDCGFECHVEPKPALAFLKKTRREVYDLIMLPTSCLLTEEEDGDWVLAPEDDGILPGSGIPGAGVVVGHKVSYDTALQASMRLLPKGTTIRTATVNDASASRRVDDAAADTAAKEAVGGATPPTAWQIVRFEDGRALNIHGAVDDPFGLASFEVLVGAAVETARAWARDHTDYQVVMALRGEVEKPTYVKSVTLLEDDPA